jgi:hypothetical protein
MAPVAFPFKYPITTDHFSRRCSSESVYLCNHIISLYIHSVHHHLGSLLFTLEEGSPPAMYVTQTMPKLHEKRRDIVGGEKNEKK